MNRRGFIQTLLGTASAIALDPEKLLWVPGEKTIFIPPPPKLITLMEWHAQCGRDEKIERIIQELIATNDLALAC